MRIRIGVAGLTGEESFLPGLPLAIARGAAALIVRVDNQTAFVSQANLSSQFQGFLHTDWITLTTEQRENFMELRGKTVEVVFSGTCISTEACSPVNLQVNMTGAHPFSMTLQVGARGNLQGSLGAHAGSFARVDLTERDEGHSHGGIMGAVGDFLSRISF